MNPQALWKISVTTTLEAEDAVADFLQNLVRQPAASYTKAETSETIVTVYLPGLSKTPAEFRPAVAAGMAQIKNCGLNTGEGKISIEKIRRRDWAESWKRHFKPMEIGPGLLIKPSWSRRHARKGQAVVVLDPGLSFGTGQHPTTAFCLQRLAAGRKRDRPQSFLDIGTGSGILAIAAAWLGYSPVDAFDFDPEAVRIARANARLNRVLEKIKITRADVTKLSRRSAKTYHVICANLISNLLIDERKRIFSRLRPDGFLIVAGILDAEFSAVQKNYERAGLRLVAGKTEKEWRSGVFIFARSGAP